MNRRAPQGLPGQATLWDLLSHVLGADVPAYNIPWRTAELNFTRKLSQDIAWRKIYERIDPAFPALNKGVTPRKRHRRGASLRRQRYNLHLTDYLSKVNRSGKPKR